MPHLLNSFLFTIKVKTVPTLSAHEGVRLKSSVVELQGMIACVGRVVGGGEGALSCDFNPLWVLCSHSGNLSFDWARTSFHCRMYCVIGSLMLVRLVCRPLSDHLQFLDVTSTF